MPTIILSKELPANVPQHPVFARRGYTGVTQGTLSEIDVHAVSTSHQVAYAGYKDNLEAFLYATAAGKKVAVSEPYYEIPDSYVPTIPLPFPNVIFQFRKALDGSQLRKFQEQLGKFNFQEHHRGKRTILYSLDNAPPNLVIGRIAPACERDVPPAYGYANLEGYAQAVFLHTAVDLFLSVNSYPGFRSDEDGDDDGNQGFQHYDLEGKLKRKDRKVRTETRIKRLRQVVKDGKQTWEASEEQAGDVEMEDLSDPEELEDELVPIYEEVLSAKPSPLPSSINYGPARECPFLPGILFEYFPGLLKPDNSFMRLFAINHLFRLFGNKDRTAKEGWRVYKRTISSYTSTEQGMIMAHILKGVELALESQTQLFVIIDHQTYLGFTLLGAKFSVFSKNTWVKPQSAEDLQESLSNLVSHDGALEKICTLLGKLPLIKKKTVTWTVDMINSPAKLAVALGEVSFTADKESDGPIHDEIAEAISATSFPTKYKGITVETLMWAILHMTTLKDKPLDDDISIFFPTNNLDLFKRREFQVLCAFGSRGPKFYAASGQTYKIPTPDEKDPLSEVDPKSDKGLIKMPIIVVGTAPPTQCLISWDQVVKNRSIRFESLERSKESRCFTFRDKQRHELWASLRLAAGTFPTPTGSAPQKGKGKEIFTAPIVDVADLDFADF